MEEEWNALYERCLQRTSFQSFDWNYSWYEKERENFDLFLITYYKTNDLSALFPFWIDKTGTLRFIADTHTDYCYFLSEIVHGSDAYVMMKHVTKKIIEEPKCKRIELKNISQNSSLIALFSTFFDNKRLLFNSNATSYISFTPKENFFSSFSHLNAKKKQVLKQMLKHNSIYRSKIHSYPSEYPEEKVNLLVNDMIARGERSEEFFNQKMLSIFNDLFKKKIIVIHEVYDEENGTVAMNIAIRLDKARYMLWIDIFKDIKKINVLSNLLFLKHLYESESEPFIFDLGRGVYEYKLKNFQPDIELQYTFFYAKENFEYSKYILKLSTKLILKDFYKKHKKSIDRFVRR